MSGGGGKPSFPSPSAGDLREIPTVPLRGAPVFLSGESHGQRSLAGYSPWHCRYVQPSPRCVWLGAAHPRIGTPSLRPRSPSHPTLAPTSAKLGTGCLVLGGTGIWWVPDGWAGSWAGPLAPHGPGLAWLRPLYPVLRLQPPCHRRSQTLSCCQMLLAASGRISGWGDTDRPPSPSNLDWGWSPRAQDCPSTSILGKTQEFDVQGPYWPERLLLSS